MTNTPKPGFAAALVDWYRTDHRTLPWRETQDPYALWLSEVMLQQTQVRTVIDYYHRFLAQYPTLAALAAAPLDDVLKLWEGLGYYARGRNLHKAAQVMLERHEGRFPETLAEAEALPGIGRSTAGAILTFAYGQKHPLLDGNVKRVLARLFDIADDSMQTGTINRMWALSEALLRETDDPYRYNQAIMELGATVCLPSNPRCLLCPVQAHCAAFTAGTQHERPVKGARKATPHHTIAIGVIWRDVGGAGLREVLIQQRPAEGLLGGLWEFPGGKREDGEALPETVRREIAEELGIEVSVGAEITVVKHAYTHFRITLHAFHCEYVSGTPEPRAAQEFRWVLPDDLPRLAFPKANKTVLEKILAEWQALQKAPV